MRSSASGARAASGAAVLLVGAAAAWLASGGAGRLRAALEPPEVGVRRALGAAERLPAGPAEPAGLRLDRVRLSDLVPSFEGGRATVIAAADAEGSLAWRGREVPFTSRGRERLVLLRCGEGWCPEAARLPRLAALLATLAARADALDDADVARYAPLVSGDYRAEGEDRAGLLRRLAADLAAPPRAAFRPVGWQLRLEREVAQVGEDYEIAVGSAAPRRLRARLDLREEGGRWRITGGLQ